MICERFDKADDWSLFYKELQSGKSADIASWLLETNSSGVKRIDRLVSVGSIQTFDRTRRKDKWIYNLHRGAAFFDVKEVAKKASKNIRYEPWFEKLLYRERFVGDVIGEICGCEIPLNETGRESKGRIDLVSVSSNKDVIYLLELKKWGSTEPLIRCLIEVYTYFRSIIPTAYKTFCREFTGKETARIILCPLIFEDSLAFAELQNKSKMYLAVEDAIDQSMRKLVGGEYRHVAYQVISKDDSRLVPLINESMIKAEVAAHVRQASDVLIYQKKTPVVRK